MKYTAYNLPKLGVNMCEMYQLQSNKRRHEWVKCITFDLPKVGINMRGKCTTQSQAKVVINMSEIYRLLLTRLGINMYQTYH